MSVLSKLRGAMGVVQRHRIETVFFTWLGIILYMQRLEATKSRKRRERGEEQKETVSIRGKKFKLVESELTNLEWTGALEFYMIVMIRMMETYGLFTMGEKGVRASAEVLGSDYRLRNISFAVFGLFPVLDLIIPEDWTNPASEDQKKHRHDAKFSAPLFLWAALSILSTYKSITIVCNRNSKLSHAEQLGLILQMALFSGVGINVAHELGHKNGLMHRLSAMALMVNTNYSWWMDEHTEGHHKHVATPLDPASARRNESIYEFLPRTYYGSFKSAMRIEKERLKETGEHPVLQNRVYGWLLATFAWATFLGKASGGNYLKTYGVFAAQGLLGATLLEFVNYVEHYGLEREKLPDGTYEPVTPTHSWNSPDRMSNAFLFKLQRHSDHHTFERRPYHLLRNFHDSPQLPTGYPGMLVLALFPPIFFTIMNPLVDANKARLKDGNEEQWQKALGTAKRKITAFSGSFFALGISLLVMSERARMRNLKVST